MAISFVILVEFVVLVSVVLVVECTHSFVTHYVSVIRTPHIDKLARDGTKFNNAFASVSSCSPRLL